MRRFLLVNVGDYVPKVSLTKPIIYQIRILENINRNSYWLIALHGHCKKLLISSKWLRDVWWTTFWSIISTSVPYGNIWIIFYALWNYHNNSHVNHVMIIYTLPILKYMTKTCWVRIVFIPKALVGSATGAFAVTPHTLVYGLSRLILIDVLLHGNSIKIMLLNFRQTECGQQTVTWAGLFGQTFKYLSL